MALPVIYSLRFAPDKTLNDYLAGLEKAVFSKSQILQIDWRINESGAIDNIVKTAQLCGLEVAIRCQTPQICDIRNSKFAEIPLHCFLRSAADIPGQSVLNEFLVSHLFVIDVGRETDLLSMIAGFHRSLWPRIHLLASPFASDDPASLTVGQIAAKLDELTEKFPDFKIKVLPGLEPYDSGIGNAYELEPVFLEPQFFVSTGTSRTPKITVIIPTYNSKYFLVNVLKHLLVQNISPDEFEIVITDDGSTDDTGVFVESFLRAENVRHNVRYYFWAKPSAAELTFFRAGHARNAGANLAKGEFLLFLDSDIILPKDFLESLLSRFDNYDVIQFPRFHISSNKSSMLVNYAHVQKSEDLYIEEEHYWKPFFDSQKWSQMDFYWKYTCTYCLAVRKSDFFEVGRFRRLFLSYGFEDTDLGYRLHNAGKRFLLSDVSVLHLSRPKSEDWSFQVTADRFFALRKTAKIFYLLNLDPQIFKHFRIYMGDERRIKRYVYDLFSGVFSSCKKITRNLENRAE